MVEERIKGKDVKLTVIACWDSEARVWVATSEDVKGLIVESPDMDSLVKDIKEIVPILLEENNQSNQVPIELLYSGKENICYV